LDAGNAALSNMLSQARKQDAAAEGSDDDDWD
jgi:hypothetical protein